MRRYFFALFFLFMCQAAHAQSRLLRLAEGFGVGFGSGIVANLASKHIDALNVDRYFSRWGAEGTPEANYAEGLKRWRAGNREEALHYMQWSAESSFSKAELFLGDVASQKGKFDEAKAWYEKSAAKQESWAEFQLGNLYYSGMVNGVADYGTALGWFRRSASRHEVRAELMVGEILMTGKLHAITRREAVEVADLLEDAAARGSGAARTNLGYMYEVGLGVGQNSCTALDLTRQAATQDIPEAIANLGAAYENGISGQQGCALAIDRAEALKLYKKAAQLGDSYAEQAATRLAAVIQRDSVNSILFPALDWLPKRHQ
jgi:TPR repeat protein